jgi:hypothetical protein
MATRSDFYVGSGKTAEWLGSVAFDGYEWAEDESCPLMVAKSEDDFRATVASILAGRPDATVPSDGWPWPWDDSSITDYAYYFDGVATRHDDRSDWPDMSAIRALAMGTKRDSIIVISLKPNSDE